MRVYIQKRRDNCPPPPLARADISNQSLSQSAQTGSQIVSQHGYTSSVHGMLKLICVMGNRYSVRTFATLTSWCFEACFGKAWLVR